MKILGNWPLCAALFWGGALIGVGVHGYAKPRGHTVFDIYAVASRGWFESDENIYLRQTETKELYRYSPTFAVVTAPLAYLSEGAGNALWKLINGGAFAYAMWVWLRRGIPNPFTLNQRGIALLLSLPVTLLSLHIGQANLIMVAFLMLGATAAVENRWWLAAVYVTAAVHTKAFPLAFAAVMCAVYWRQFPGRFAVTMAVSFALPFATQRPQYVIDQTRLWFHCLNDARSINRDRLKSLDRLMEVVGCPIDHRTLMAVGALAGLAVLGATVWYAVRSPDRRQPLTQALAWFLAWALLFSPSAEAATFSILAPVIGWALVVVFSRPGAWAGRVLVSLSFFLTGPAQTDLIGKTAREFGGEYAAPTIGTLLFAVWLVGELARSVISSRRSEPMCCSASSPDSSTGRTVLAPG